MRIATACLLAACAACLANDAATLEFIGFSGDGRYFAWEQYGVQDGSGFPWSEITIQETDGGAVAESFLCVLEDESLEGGDARAACLAEASGALSLLSAGEWLPGVRCIHHPPTDLGEYPSGVRFCSTFHSPGYRTGDYGLSLHTVEVAGSDMEEWLGVAPVLLEVRFTDMETGTVQVIERETAQDERWAYTFSYSVSDVWCLEDRFFAAALDSRKAGFEGADLRYRLVGWVR